MANTFKVVSHDVMPASAGSPEDLYTCPTSPATTTVVIGLMVANVHTAQVTFSETRFNDIRGRSSGYKHNNLSAKRYTDCCR